MKKLIYPFLLLIFLVSVTGCESIENLFNPQNTELILYAPNSLKSSLEELQPIFQEQNKNIILTVNYDSSNSISSEVLSGSKPNLIILSSQKDAAELLNKKLVNTENKTVILTNELVLIANENSGLTNIEELPSNLVETVYIGKENSVACGYYANEALKNMGLIDQLGSKVIDVKNVESILNGVRELEDACGFVFRSDATGKSGIKEVQAVSTEMYTPVNYTLYEVTSSITDDNQILIDFLKSPEAQQVFNSHGFTQTIS